MAVVPFHWDLIHVNVSLHFVPRSPLLGVYSRSSAAGRQTARHVAGGLRSSAQLISYEMAVAFALVGAVILAGSLDLEKIVLAQHDVWFVQAAAARLPAVLHGRSGRDQLTAVRSA